MYSEDSDFLRHDQEIDRFLNLLRDSRQTVSPESLILDVGGGLGMHAWKLLPLCRKLYITDVVSYSSIYDGHLIHLVAEKHQRNNRPFDLNKVAFIESDAQSQLFRNGMFDVVISINAFEHIPNPGMALCEIIRVTKPSGLIYLTFDPLWNSPTGGHFHDYVKEPWAHLLWSEREYKSKMQAAGASESELADYPGAMNRRRVNGFRELFAQAQSQKQLQILATQTWPANREEEPHSQHPNFAKLRGMGYLEEDLIVRGMLVLARRTSGPYA
jgi:ubiquinone/menaquinone biosynthesis C-methylase UbiE